jgi:hypothetical protein
MQRPSGFDRVFSHIAERFFQKAAECSLVFQPQMRGVQGIELHNFEFERFEVRQFLF